MKQNEAVQEALVKYDQIVELMENCTGKVILNYNWGDLWTILVLH